MAFKAPRILAFSGPGANQKQRWLGRAFAQLSKTREGDGLFERQGDEHSDSRVYYIEDNVARIYIRQFTLSS